MRQDDRLSRSVSHRRLALMTFKFRVALITGCALFGAVAPILAHHSFAAEYDSTKTVTVKGTVSNLSWVNPHAYVYVDVKNASGKVTTWAFESLSPNALYRGDLFAAEHGSWNRTSPSGHELVRVPLQKGKSNGVYEDFMTFPGGDGTWGRPVGVVTGADGALYVTDDAENMVWRISTTR